MILAVESSAITASVAVADKGKIIGAKFIDCGLTHSETLLPLCKSLLDELGLKVSDMDAFAVTAGPGSFTGLRIGIATVKGFMAATGKKCVPLSTLEVIAMGGKDENAVISAVMDARAGQVYNALFKAENGKITRLCEDRAITVSALIEENNKFDRVIYFGDGAHLFEGQEIADKERRFQNAANAALLAESKESIGINELCPIYLRLPQAERELLSKEKNK